MLGGSSRCQKCSNSYLALLLPFSLVGIALLLLLFLLKFTVNYGTLSGLIFYANIFHVNLTFDQSRDQNNMFTVFIAWPNLDFGINTCFIKSTGQLLEHMAPVCISTLHFVTLLSYNCHQQSLHKVLDSSHSTSVFVHISEDTPCNDNCVLFHFFAISI